jgi:hypothetical protein
VKPSTLTAEVANLSGLVAGLPDQWRFAGFRRVPRVKREVTNRFGKLLTQATGKKLKWV